MTYEELRDAIQEKARIDHIHRWPEKKDPGWPKWSALAYVGETRYLGKGDTDLQALQNLLEQLADVAPKHAAE